MCNRYRFLLYHPFIRNILPVDKQIGLVSTVCFHLTLQTLLNTNFVSNFYSHVIHRPCCSQTVETKTNFSFNGLNIINCQVFSTDMVFSSFHSPVLCVNRKIAKNVKIAVNAVKRCINCDFQR